MALSSNWALFHNLQQVLNPLPGGILHLGMNFVSFNYAFSTA
jgi:hypothetical protein